MKRSFSSRYKHRVLSTINKAEEADYISKGFDVFIMTLILLNVFVVITETVESIYSEYKAIFYYFEIFTITVFSIEYVVRIWACTLIEKYRHPVFGRIKYMFSMEALIDLLAILPFYLPLFFAIDARFVRVLRLFRLMRVFKLGRYSVAFQLIVSAVSKRKEELLITLTLLIIMLILASSLMYYIEHEVQPDTFTSIPATMWWAIATLTTVGYGDVYPVTALGKLLASTIAILGIGVFALPTGIIATSFERELSERDKNKKAARQNENK
ncbi:ion transporter [Fulvivirga sp. M361]|uniref:ion transporter n=1 Tax=Fulvivirga sp. M361 TaxID=2594266 RepID=UPI001179B683|nr:ion transporter [Fulvivirga sp. M361]TRX50640.1 ion transporter [Fulvivirga sp. M361]